MNMAASATECCRLNSTPSNGGEYCDAVDILGEAKIDSVSANIIFNKEETF
jgi:hypothetical protein